MEGVNKNWFGKEGHKYKKKEEKNSLNVCPLQKSFESVPAIL